MVFGLSEQLIINAIIGAAGYTIVATALFGQFNYLKMLSLSLLASICTGAYFSNLLYLALGIKSFLLPMVGTILIGGIIGGIGATIHNFIGHENKFLGLLASLGFYLFIVGLIQILTGGGVSNYNYSLPKMFDSSIEPSWFFSVIFIVILTMLVEYIVLRKTSIGLKAIAIGDDNLLAKYFGINVLKIEFLIQIIGGSVGGLAGIILAVDAGLQPDIGFSTALKVFAILLLIKEKLLLIPIVAFGLALIEEVVTYYGDGQLSEALGLSFVVITMISFLVYEKIVNKYAISRTERTS